MQIHGKYTLISKLNNLYEVTMDDVKYIPHQIDASSGCKKYPLHTDGGCQYFEEQSQTWHWHLTWTVSGEKLNSHNQKAQLIIHSLVFAKNRDQMWALVNTVINCQVP
jgi:hypothetical protein